MTTLTKIDLDAAHAALAVAYRAHPAAMPPGAEFAPFRQPPFWPPAWNGAARLLPLPATLDHPVPSKPAAAEPAVLPPLAAPPPQPVANASSAREPATIEPPVIAAPAPAPHAAPPVKAPPEPPTRESATKARQRRRLLWPVLGAAAAVLAIAVGLGAWRQRPPPKLEIAASFKAPVLVLRASRPGTVDSFAVKPGEHVSPATVMVTLQVPSPPDPMALAAADRVAAAQRRVDTLQTAAQQPVPQTAANHARQADLQHQLDQAEFDLASAQDALSHLTPPDPTEMPIVAGAHGVVLSLEAREGTQATAGTPLIRMADCDHGYVALDGPSSLDPGSLVEAHLPDQPPMPATLRPASRVSGPLVAMIAEPAPGTFAQSCPLGAAGTVTPIPPAG